MRGLAACKARFISTDAYAPGSESKPAEIAVSRAYPYSSSGVLSGGSGSVSGFVRVCTSGKNASGSSNAIVSLRHFRIHYTLHK